MTKLQFIAGNLYDAKDVLAVLPNLTLVKTDGQGPWQMSLYFDPDSNLYFEKGPFGRWDAVCFRALTIKTPEDWNPPK